MYEGDIKRERMSGYKKIKWTVFFALTLQAPAWNKG